MEGKELTDDDISDLIALPIGGVCCGLYKKEVLKNSGICFPEHVRYEDNYWASLIKPFFRKVAFVENIGVFYRQNPNSTVHTKNQSYQFDDRVFIEHLIIEDAKKRGFLDRFWLAYEWGYTFRYAVNTFYIYLKTHDNPDMHRVQNVVSDLKDRFPKWYKNPYFKRDANVLQKIKYAITIFTPQIASRLYLIIKRFRTA